MAATLQAVAVEWGRWRGEEELVLGHRTRLLHRTPSRSPLPLPLATQPPLAPATQPPFLAAASRSSAAALAWPPSLPRLAVSARRLRS